MITNCIRCNAKPPGEHNKWDGWKRWLIYDVPEDADDLVMVCPKCITSDEQAGIDRARAEEALSGLAPVFEVAAQRVMYREAGLNVPDDVRQQVETFRHMFIHAGLAEDEVNGLVGLEPFD